VTFFEDDMLLFFPISYFSLATFISTGRKSPLARSVNFLSIRQSPVG
jgi:hypothetical protein